MRLLRGAKPMSSLNIHRRVQRIRHLLLDSRGNTIPIVATALVPMLGVIGASVDIGAAYMVKSQLRAAVDAAVLAGGTVMGDTDKRNQEIDKYFKANFPDGYMRTTLTRFDITPEQAPNPADADLVNLRLEAEITFPTFFLHIFGDKLASLDLEAKAEVATGKKLNSLEAILVLDNTYSMSSSTGGQTRIRALREAAKTFVDTVYAGDADTHSNIAIGVIPYTTTVNVGWLLKKQYVHQMPPFTTAAASSTNKMGWAGCIEAAYTIQDISTPATTMNDGAHDTHARTPGTGGVPLFMPQLSPPIKPDNLYKVDSPNDGIWKTVLTTWYHGSNRLAGRSILNAQGNINTGALRSPKTNSLTSTKSGDWDLYTSNQWKSAVTWNPGVSTSPSPNADCPAQALPPKWGATPASLKTWIDDYNHAVRPGWGTHSNLGMAWAYRMLRAPHLFNNIVPDNPNEKPEVEAIILMTDGEINYINSSYDKISGLNRLATDDQGLPLKIGHGRYTAYRTPHEKALTSYLPDTKVGTKTADVIAEDQMSHRLQMVCEAARKDGIRVYTIAFAISSTDTITRNLYRTCATSPRYFFDTASPEALKDAFRMIAVDLVQLHLVE